MENNILVAFEEFCKENNMKKTNQRLAVFEAIFHNDTHPTVDDIVKAVKQKLPMVSVESIYRILGDFDKTKLISKMPLPSHIRYDCNTQNHNHFICSKCHKIIDIYDLNLKLPPEFSHCKDVSLTISALCKECSEAI